MCACSWAVRTSLPLTKHRCLRLKRGCGGVLYTGSNWIPAHNFLTALEADDYRAWLTLLRDGNQNMVRLWGGGVYEPDAFYDICDGACIRRALTHRSG